jgi:cell division protein FtsW (lipid II flippase)
MAENNDQNSSPFGQQPNGGRALLGGICLVAIVLLLMIGHQTVPGDMGEAARSGGWWAEPALAPGVALVLTIVASAIAFFYTRPEKIDWTSTVQTYGRILLIAGCMVATVALMKVLGFALSILVFAMVVAFIGGFRRLRLLAVAISTTVAMVLIFRVGFGIWFPRPELF